MAKRYGMTSGKSVFLAVLLFLSVALLPLSVAAETDFDIVPKLLASWQYDSNYFLAETNERPVFTYLLQPGIDLGIQTAKSSVKLDYTLNAYWYDDRDTVPPLERAASDDDYVGHNLDLQMRYQAFTRLQFGLDDLYLLTRDPAQSDAFSNSILRLKYHLNALTPFLVYEFGPKFSVAARYRNTKINYVDTDIGDSDENRGIFDFIYNLNSRNSIDLQYQYWQKNYDVPSDSDYTSNQIQLLFRRQMRAFDIIIGGGYQNRKFDDSALGDIGKPVFKLIIDGEIIEKRRAYATFSAEQNLNDQSFSDDYFLATRFGLNGGYEFTSKLSAGALASYQLSDYQLTSRKDKTFTVSGNVNYRLARWMALNVAVGYENRDSNINGLSYDDTFVIASLNFSYELGRK